MEEQLLQFIWHRRLYHTGSLTTTEGELLTVIDPGTPNTDQGPDFLLSRVRIGDRTWIGQVEVHVRSSAWFLHRHEKDPGYNNVILHVVWEEDRPARTENGIRPPCLTLAGRVSPDLLDRYRALLKNEAWVPCAGAVGQVPEVKRTAWLARIMAERLEAKADTLGRLLDRTRWDWEQVFFVWLARYLGAPTNAEAMEALALRIPLKMLRKHADRQDQAEALLFGTAGMLSADWKDPYPRSLALEFRFLRRKYGIKPMAGSRWRFHRMRPAHFPTLRIAQLAVLVLGEPGLMARLEGLPSIQDWIRYFRSTPAHPYWLGHYHFGKSSPPAPKVIGRSLATGLVVNVVGPMAFAYSRHQGNRAMRDYAIGLWQSLPPERNHILVRWSALGWPARDAAESQALLHLFRAYCTPRQCLRCAVGHALLRPPVS